MSLSNTPLACLIVFCLLLAGCTREAPRAGAQSTQPNVTLTADHSDAATSTKLAEFSTDDWPWWRGEGRQGHAHADQDPPLAWSETKNVIWKTPVSGRGHGSVTIVGDQVLLATADEQAGSQAVLCFDRETGVPTWTAKVHERGAKPAGNGKSSLASSTVACDGERLFINFYNSDAVFLSALDRVGKTLWQKKVCDYVMHQGFGASPCIYGPIVIVAVDHKGGGTIAAYDRESGDVVWQHARPKLPNYSSPVVLHVAGKDQLIFIGCNLVSSYEPLSGKKNWEIDGATEECVITTVTDGKHIYTSGGYPRNHMAAIRADGSGEVAWENTVRVYVPSFLEKDGYLYAVTDNGVAMCFKSDTGEEIWKGRIGGTFSSSPVLVGQRIYAIDEAGKCSIFSATPDKFELLGVNQLGSETFATPTIVGGRIYYRMAETKNGQRQEMLYCLGEGT
jgi:outer membrane protein assembly factor BamB